MKIIRTDSVNRGNPESAQNRALVHRAQRQIISCEACNPDAEMPFDWLLDRLIGRSGAVTGYVLAQPVKCLQCGTDITEKTLEEWGEDDPFESGLALR